MTPEPTPQRPSLFRSDLGVFLVIVAGLFVLRVILAFVLVPVVLSYVLSVVASVLFVGLPVYGMYRASALPWTAKTSSAVLAVGAVVHIVAGLALNAAAPGTAKVVLGAVQQTGILLWTLGLGVLLGRLVNDKNLMIPVALFLIGFDMFLVFNPDAPTSKILRESPRLAQAIVATVPDVKATGDPVGEIQNLAYIGPADFLFSAAFFCMMWRFGMRARRTFVWLLPILVAYLLTVIRFGDYQLGPLPLAMLPAMVPIGLTVLLVNRREFKVQPQEAVGIALVALLSVGLAAFGVFRASQARTQTEPPTVPSMMAPSLVNEEPEGSPSPAR